MATLESIQARIAKLQAQAEAIVANKSTVVLNKIRDLMAKHGITVADVEAHAGKRRGRKAQSGAAAGKSAAVAKYADPKTGATWTGHGRAPAWIANAKDRSKFLVDGPVTASSGVVKASAKKGNYVRGPQPAVYQDPKSGATWSGRGRAPAWIASAKDRTRYLIANPGSAEEQSKPAKKAASAKKAAPVKKAVTTKKSALATKSPMKKAAQKKANAPVKKAAAKKAVVTEAANTEVAGAFAAETQAPPAAG
ncbi:MULTISPECIES: H-NS family nucleoid-associated regulatory protein [unclassified Paraburkholderia]|uniref:H-NS family nucleoid-associated regulatory protein n=1 Tax=unclassified Paraburkholderia TaxID=2615204 RepID=UPI002AAFF8AD|nr:MULTISPECIES: H-NS family nucleoid-associated regulatory protein [unclassified Paraburkholderia]